MTYFSVACSGLLFFFVADPDIRRGDPKIPTYAGTFGKKGARQTITPRLAVVP
jgi:hypothetical protein